MKKHISKIIVLLCALTLALTFALTGCGNTPAPDKESTEERITEESKEEGSSEIDSETPEEPGTDAQSEEDIESFAYAFFSAWSTNDYASMNTMTSSSVLRKINMSEDSVKNFTDQLLEAFGSDAVSEETRKSLDTFASEVIMGEVYGYQITDIKMAEDESSVSATVSFGPTREDVLALDFEALAEDIEIPDDKIEEFAKIYAESGEEALLEAVNGYLYEALIANIRTEYLTMEGSEKPVKMVITPSETSYRVINISIGE